MLPWPIGLGITLRSFFAGNLRVNLTAIRDEEGILSRHFVESIALRPRTAGRHPHPFRTSVRGRDFRASQFLYAVRGSLFPWLSLRGRKQLSSKKPFGFSAYTEMYCPNEQSLFPSPFDCVTLRAVDRMTKAIEVASALVAPAAGLP